MTNVRNYTNTQFWVGVYVCVRAHVLFFFFAFNKGKLLAPLTCAKMYCTRFPFYAGLMKNKGYNATKVVSLFALFGMSNLDATS